MYKNKYIYTRPVSTASSARVSVPPLSPLSLSHTKTHTHTWLLSQVWVLWRLTKPEKERQLKIILEEDGLQAQRHHLSIPKMPLVCPSAASPLPISQVYHVFFHSSLWFKVTLLFPFYLLLSLSLYSMCRAGDFSSNSFVFSAIL